jgi:hypothetical protein
MPRANRFHLPGHVWHLTHRCHQREFLLEFAPRSGSLSLLVVPGKEALRPVRSRLRNHEQSRALAGKGHGPEYHCAEPSTRRRSDRPGIQPAPRQERRLLGRPVPRDGRRGGRTPCAVRGVHRSEHSACRGRVPSRALGTWRLRERPSTPMRPMSMRYAMCSDSAASPSFRQGNAGRIGTSTFQIRQVSCASPRRLATRKWLTRTAA